jgi:hypothetical protein
MDNLPFELLLMIAERIDNLSIPFAKLSCPKMYLVLNYLNIEYDHKKDEFSKDKLFFQSSNTLRFGIEIGIIQEYFLTLEKAVYYESLECLKYLIMQNIKPIHRTIYLAASKGNLEIYKYLLSIGLHIAESHFDIAAELGHLDILNFLEGKEPNHIMNSLNTGKKLYIDRDFFLHALQMGKIEYFEYIESKVGFYDWEKDFPISIAAKQNHIGMIRYLVEDRKLVIRNSDSLIVGAIDGNAVDVLEYLDIPKRTFPIFIRYAYNQKKDKSLLHLLKRSNSEIKFNYWNLAFEKRNEELLDYFVSRSSQDDIEMACLEEVYSDMYPIEFFFNRGLYRNFSAATKQTIFQNAYRCPLETFNPFTPDCVYDLYHFLIEKGEKGEVITRDVIELLEHNKREMLELLIKDRFLFKDQVEGIWKRHFNTNTPFFHSW